ncbi:hypothetical protein HY546_03350, partial [archaeon]|nr:hypothetical protein [archaeon]
IKESLQFTTAGTIGFAPFESIFGGEPTPSDDVSELRFVTPKEAIKLMPREAEKSAVRKYLEILK